MRGQGSGLGHCRTESRGTAPPSAKAGTAVSSLVQMDSWMLEMETSVDSLGRATCVNFNLN